MTPQNRVSQTGSTDAAFTYDVGGDVQADGLNNYSYDAEGRLAAVNGSTAYVYGPEGERVATMQGGAVTAEYLSGIDGMLRTTLAPGGKLMRGLLYGGGMHLADYPQNGKTVFHLYDEVGSLVNTIDQTGAAIESCVANPFGESLNCSPSVDYTENHFTDKKRDQESGLDYFGVRYYGSTLGRFMSPDYPDGDYGPVGIPDFNPSNPQSLNLYSYVRNNPLMNTDPDGHDCAVQSRTSSTTESVSVSSGNCDNVNVGDGQSKTYVPGTVTGISANGHNSIDIGYNSYDGQSSGVTNSAAAQAPESPGLAYNYGNNAQGYQMLGAASRAVNAATAGYAVVFGSAGAGAVIGGAGGLTTLGSLASDLTVHSEEAALLARHGITPDEARAAIEAAKKAGTVVEAMGRYGPQLRYDANGIRVVVATTGRNAGKIITAFFK